MDLSDSGRGLRALFPATAVVLGLSRVWVGGYSFGTGDHAWQVPLVKGIAQGQPLRDYIFQEPLTLSFYFPVVAFFARFWRVETVYFAGYVIASAAAALALYLLAARMLVSRPAGLLAVVLLAVGKSTVAGATTWDAMLLPRTAAIPILCAGWWLLLEGRATRAGLLAGLAFALHPLTGAYGLAIAFAAIVLAERDTWSPLWRFSVGAAVPVAATILYARGTPLALWSATPEWNEAMLARNLHHLTASNMAVLVGVLVYAMGATAYTGLTGGRSRLLIGATAAGAAVFTYYAAALAWGYFGGFRHSEIALLKPPVLAMLQPLRISGLMGILLFAATAGMLWRAMQKGLSGRICAVGATVGLCWGHYAIGTAFLAGALLLQDSVKWRRAAGAAFGLAALVGTVIFLKTVLVLLSAVVVAAALAALATKNTRFSAASATLLATVALVGVVPAGWAHRAAVKTFGQDRGSDRGRYSRSVETVAPAEEGSDVAAQWVRENAAADEVTIVPPWWESFRVTADRPIYGTYKDGTLLFFNTSLAKEWIDRMELLGVPLRVGQGPRQGEGDRALYARLREEEIALAATRHPAKYVVRFGKDLPAFRVAFEGEGIVIYEIAPPKEGE